MTNNGEAHDFGTAALGEAAEAYLKYWSDLTSKMAGAAFAASPASTPPQAMREVRSAMLKAMSDASDQYMRSPQFQEVLRQWFANSVQLRSQVNDWSSRVRHEMQGVSRQDVDALVQAINRLETRVSDALAGISERLEAVEARGATTERARQAGPARRPRPARARKAKS